ncbi:MAG TPA: VOC family protein [Mycobacteriales bacterium]|nr:VOC family protein [Mycobacteriales bacterium]
MPEKTAYQPGEPIWTDLATPDMDRTVAFYTSLLGWEFGGGSEEFGGYGMFTKNGKSVAGVMPVMSPEQPPVWTSYVTSSDADKTIALVTERGGTVLAPPMDVADLGRMAVFTDPVGAAIGIWQPGTMTGAELVDEEGVMSWIELASRDQDTAIPFYEQVFGWETHRNPGYTEFATGGRSVAGCMDMPEMVPAEVPSYWMPYVQAGDPAAKAQEAASLGATVLVPFMEMEQVAFSVVQDPHGSTFGLLNVKE